MKYFVWINQESQYNDYNDDIIDFLWNNGNEVHLSSNYSTADFNRMVQHGDCIMLLSNTLQGSRI